MKILNKLYNFFTKDNLVLGFSRTRKITDFDNADFRDEQFKKNILFIS